MGRLSGKTIAVTGAGSGIGRATAALCLAEGATVWALDRDAESIRDFACAMACDVASSNSVEAAFAAIERLDGLVNSAGIAQRFPVAEQDEAGWDAVMRVNLKGIYLCSKAAIARMRGPASIVHIASAAGLIGVRNRAAYSATKGAIVSLTRNMALDYAGRGIRVNCVCPGFTRTPLIEKLLADPERRARIESLHPLGRLGEAEDIAKAVVFLLSDDSSWITGIALAVDGGLSAGHQHDI